GSMVFYAASHWRGSRKEEDVTYVSGETHRGESPNISFCGRSRRVGLPFFGKVMTQMRSNAPGNFGGFFTPSSTAMSRIAWCSQQISTVFPSYSGLPVISLTIFA